MTQSIPLALVGFKDARLDWAVVARRCQAESRGQLRDPATRHVEGLALLYLGEFTADSLSAGPINTLGNLRVELSASRQLIVGNPEDYFSGSNPAWWQFMEKMIAPDQREKQMPLPLRSLANVGILISRWEEAMIHNDPSASSLQKEIQRQLPKAIASDSGADWSLWAGHQVPLTAP